MIDDDDAIVVMLLLVIIMFTNVMIIVNIKSFIIINFISFVLSFSRVIILVLIMLIITPLLIFTPHDSSYAIGIQYLAEFAYYKSINPSEYEVLVSAIYTDYVVVAVYVVDVYDRCLLM
jgi:hypothetical protein